MQVNSTQLACRVEARVTNVTCAENVPLRPTLRRDSPRTPLRREAKTGGKGIRTPDLLIANETLYQLSYTPEVFRLLGFKVQNLICISTGTPPVLPP
jgi:hypothetical protein